MCPSRARSGGLGGKRLGGNPVVLDSILDGSSLVVGFSMFYFGSFLSLTESALKYDSFLFLVSSNQSNANQLVRSQFFHNITPGWSTEQPSIFLGGWIWALIGQQI